MTVGLDQFLRRLKSSGLGLPAGWESLVRSGSCSDGEQLAQLLVAKVVLTRYQAQVLLGYREGPLVLDNYIVLSRLGEGGMGEVYRALHRHIRRTVAVKVLHASYAARNERSVQRFYREVRTLAQLQHPHIVTAHDAGQHQGTLFLVMEYVRGLDFAVLVHRHGPLPLLLALEYLRQAASGLQYAHRQGVVHRDIKPRNLLLELPDCSEEELKKSNPRFYLQHQGSVKILDLRLALWRAENDSLATHLTQTGEVMGTVDYMSPEQSESTHDVDARSDIYSLGCTLFFLLTGHPPYRTGSPIQIILAHRTAPIPSLAEAVRRNNPRWADALPPSAAEALLHGTERLFARMVAKRPEDRFGSMEELIQQLQALLLSGTETETLMQIPPGEEPAETTPVSDTLPELFAPENKGAAAGQSPAAATPPRRRRAAWVSLLAVVAGVLVVLAGLFGLWRSDESAASGTLVLASSQPELAGAQVLLDGRTAGRLASPDRPLRLQVPGRKEPWSLTVRKPGFEPFRRRIRIQPGQQLRVRVRMAPRNRPNAPGGNSTAPATASDARRLAEWVLARQGAVTVAQDRRRWVVRTQRTIPRKPFRVVGVDLFNNNLALRLQCTDGALAAILPLMHDVEQLDLHNTLITDRTLQALSRLERLESLRLGLTDISSQGLIHLLPLKRLRHLDLLGTSVTDRGLQALARLERLEHLVLRQTPVTDRGVALLVRLKKLKHLDLSETTVSPAVGRWLKQLSCLEELWLNRVKVDETLFQQLAELPELKLLALAGTDTSDAHLPHIRRIPQLRTLDLSETRVSGAGLQHLGGHPHLEEVFINRSPLARHPVVDDQALAALASIGNLFTLELAYASLSDQGLQALVQAKQLRRLSLKGVKLRRRGLAAVAALPRLRRLSLAHASFDPDSLAALAPAQQLVELDLSHTPINDQSLEHIGRLKTLTRLILVHTRITNAGLRHLGGLKELTYLDVRETGVTLEGARELRQKLGRRCFVFLD